MNKKLFLGAAALTTVAVGGYVYYRWVQTKVLTDIEKALEEAGIDLDEDPDDEPMSLAEEALKEGISLDQLGFKQPELKTEETDG